MTRAAQLPHGYYILYVFHLEGLHRSWIAWYDGPHFDVDDYPSYALKHMSCVALTHVNACEWFPARNAC